MGKSTYAKKLSEELKAPIYRVFRSNNIDAHWQDGMVKTPEVTQEWLKKLGVPTNNHVEEMFTADLLSVLKPNIILDRSLPSSIAYGRTVNRSNPNDTAIFDDSRRCQELYNWWEARMKKAGALLVWMTAPYEVARARATGRDAPNKELYMKLHKVFQKLFQVTTLPKLSISTDSMEIEDGVRLICQRLRS